MFNQENWHNQIVQSLNVFARNPWQDVQMNGAATLLGYLAARTVEPFVDAFQQEPINAVQTLAAIVHNSGADHLVRRAHHLRYQSARLLEREFHTHPDLCLAVEQVMVTLQVVQVARQRLNSTRDEWFRQTLMHELSIYPPHMFLQIRHVLQDAGWKLRHNAIASLKERQGQFTPAELIMLSEALKDSSSDVRTAAARRLGDFAQTPPLQMIKTLLQVALHDRDMQTRYAAARALGSLRDRIASPEVLDHIFTRLSDEDCFVRSAAVMVVVELGDLAGIPKIITQLVALLNDNDVYVQEGAAHALGRMGRTALTREVMDALANAMQEGESVVHEAALEAMLQLRKLRGTQPIKNSSNPTTPLSATASAAMAHSIAAKTTSSNGNPPTPPLKKSSKSHVA